MTFDYFNTSHLAFGSKITKAFTQLERLLSEGEDNLQDLFAIYEFYNQYIDKNYPAPFPTRPDAPVRAKELYDLLNDGNTLKNIYIDEDEVLHVSVNLFKRISNRFTIATGSTTLKKGYAFCRDSMSNKNYTREIQFVEDYESGIGNFLFEFRIDADNNINIVGDESLNYYLPSNFDHITSMRKDNGYIFQSSRLDRASDVYTAQDYEVILLVGYMSPNDADNPRGTNISDLHYTVNGEERMKLCGRGQRAFDVAYLKPGDILRASCKYAFKVKYISGEAIPPQPEPEPPETKVDIVEGKYSGGVNVGVNYDIPQDFSELWNRTTGTINIPDSVIETLNTNGTMDVYNQFATMTATMLLLPEISDGNMKVRCTLPFFEGITSDTYANLAGLYVTKTSENSWQRISRLGDVAPVSVDAVIPEGYNLVMFLSPYGGSSHPTVDAYSVSNFEVVKIESV